MSPWSLNNFGSNHRRLPHHRISSGVLSRDLAMSRHQPTAMTVASPCFAVNALWEACVWVRLMIGGYFSRRIPPEVAELQAIPFCAAPA